MVGLTIIHIFGFDIPRRCRSPKSAAWRFNSPTSCGMCERMPSAAGTICRAKIGSDIPEFHDLIAIRSGPGTRVLPGVAAVD